jgi:hypothetical protein
MRNKAADQYQYKCKEAPMCGLCDKAACLTRKFGVGDGEGIEHDMIQSVRRVVDDIPYYIVTALGVDGKPVEFSMGPELMSAKGFVTAMFLYAQRCIKLPPKFRWMDYIRPMVETCEAVEPPQALSNSGRVRELFREWTMRHCPSTRDLDRVDTGSPFYDSEMGAIIFRGSGFDRHLQRNGIRLKDRELWPILKDQLRISYHTVTLSNNQEIECFKVACPDPSFIEPVMAEFVAVDNFFLEGVTSNEVGSMIPVMDTKEREFAISFGEFLRVCSQDLWSTGLWEDDETDTGIEG